MLSRVNIQTLCNVSLRHLRMDLMTFQTIYLSVRTSQELDFRLITTSKNNFSENHISRPTP